MIIDACYSGGATMQMTTVAISLGGVALTRSGGSPDVARVLPAAKGLRSDIAVMSGARTDETAIDLGPSVGGLFTSRLMSALSATHGSIPLEEIYRNYVWAPCDRLIARKIPPARLPANTRCWVMAARGT